MDPGPCPKIYLEAARMGTSIAILAWMAIPMLTNEPSHHPFEIEVPDETHCEGLQMTGNQGIRFANQQQHQLETLPRVSISGLEPENRQNLAERFNQRLSLTRPSSARP